MHEASIVEALLDRVEGEARAQGASAVHRVHVRLGELCGVEHDLLRSAYEMLRERGVCAGAELEIAAIEARWVCPGCEQVIGRGRALRCDDCGLPARLESGDEILLERIEMEVGVN
ncbi:MAG: hydrogenase maturation nickel metallochaperone HypA [Thermoanaerobaculia bacterium]|nr:hydrogenase maturation nickel metallochaperone HypA [Thermoanaerobaculia bacterium]